MGREEINEHLVSCVLTSVSNPLLVRTSMPFKSDLTSLSFAASSSLRKSLVF